MGFGRDKDKRKEETYGILGSRNVDIKIKKGTPIKIKCFGLFRSLWSTENKKLTGRWTPYNPMLCPVVSRMAKMLKL